ncbi:MAG: hypothetical protein OXU81_23145 [Gammaproteobacteria bacterium]|nr:hypothetical protein [Gammaproteobacteria bacterium]
MTIVRAARILVLVALGAASLPAFPEDCRTLANSDSQWSDHLVDLFLHSQLAETEVARRGEPLTCGNRVSDVGREQPLVVPRRLINRMGDEVVAVVDKRAWVEQRGSVLYAACTLEDFQAAVEFTVRPVDGRIEVTTGGVGRPEANQAWAPLEVVSRNPLLIRFAGTNVFDPSEVRADFFGESCVFPAARYVFDVLCEAHRTGNLYPDDGVPTHRHPIPILAGHSLGAAVVQYIALHHSRPQQGPWPECNGVRAYAFGSIGLEAVPDGARVEPPSSLETYASDCDWVTQFFFRSRVQRGHIVSIDAWSHLLDSIQGDLCECMRGSGTFSPIGNSPPGVTNSQLCSG